MSSTTKPFLRPAPPEGEPSPPCPPGCVAEVARNWNGELVEVVYDPDRHRVAFFWGDPKPQVEAALRAEGWKQVGRDETAAGMWVLDKVAAARTRLQRTPTMPARSRDLILP